MTQLDDDFKGFQHFSQLPFVTSSPVLSQFITGKLGDSCVPKRISVWYDLSMHGET